MTLFRGLTLAAITVCLAVSLAGCGVTSKQIDARFTPLDNRIAELERNNLTAEMNNVQRHVATLLEFMDKTGRSIQTLGEQVDRLGTQTELLGTQVSTVENTMEDFRYRWDEFVKALMTAAQTLEAPETDRGAPPVDTVPAAAKTD